MINQCSSTGVYMVHRVHELFLTIHRKNLISWGHFDIQMVNEAIENGVHC